MLQNAGNLNSRVEYNDNDNETDTDATRPEPDLVTGAVLEYCEYSVTWLYELDVIKSGHVGYNEQGWSLLGIAVKADARKVIDRMIKLSGY